MNTPDAQDIRFLRDDPSDIELVGGTPVSFRMAHNHDPAEYRPTRGPAQCCGRHALAAWREQTARLGYGPSAGHLDQDRITRRLAELDTPPVTPRIPAEVLWASPLMPATLNRIAAGIRRYSRTA